MQLPSKQRTNYASMSGNIMNFKANAANLNDGTPQVSILASASEKRMQERRRRSRLSQNAKGMGVGKKYPSVGTHHRNTKHVWLFSELAEVSAAYMEHHTTMPLWAIADMLYHSFSHQVQYNQQREAKLEEEKQQEAIDNDNQPIYQFQEPRVHVPSIQAIQAKLMDCISLYHNETFGVAIPSQMHGEVWSHLILAKKHREMLKQQVEIKQEQEQDMKLNPLASVWNVHPTSFYIPDAEIDAAEPPAKRRKVVFEDDEETQQQQQPQIKQEQTEEPVPQQEQQHQQQVDELMSLLEDSHLSHQHEREIIQKLVEDIRRQNHRIGVLVGNLKDAHEEIEECRETIQLKMEQIESIVNPTTPPASEPQTPQTQTQTNEDDEDCCGGDCDCWSEDDDDHHPHGNYYCGYELDYDSSGWEDQPKRGDYDHAEECS
jgi:hypothetical protein